MEKENKRNIYYRFSSEEELNSFIGEKENVAVLVNTYGRKSISKGYEKEIERYCKRHNYNLVHTFLHKEEQSICELYKEILKEAFNDSEEDKKRFTKLIVLDIKHISKSVYEIMSLDTMLLSNGIEIMILNCDITLKEYLKDNIDIFFRWTVDSMLDNMYIYDRDENNIEDEDIMNSNKTPVVLFINAVGGSLRNYEAKKQLLISYCEDNNYYIVDILKYEGNEENYLLYKNQLNLILKNPYIFDYLLMYDMKELADSVEILYVILEMLADNDIQVETICDGYYNNFCDGDIKFEIKLKESKPSLSYKLKD